MICREMAEQEFVRFCDAMAIEHDESAMPEGDLEDFKAIRGAIVSAIASGRVTINDNGEPVLALSSEIHGKSSLTFREFTGGNLRAADGVGKNDNVRRMFALMAAQCGTSVATFDAMPQRDLKIAQKLFQLFLA